MDGNPRYIKRSTYDNSTTLTSELNGDVEIVEQRGHFQWIRSKSCGALKCLDQVGQTAMEGALSAPSCHRLTTHRMILLDSRLVDCGDVNQLKIHHASCTVNVVFVSQLVRID